MTPRSREDDEDWLNGLITRLVKQIEESWLRIVVSQLDTKTTEQHRRASEKTAVLNHRVDAVVAEMHGQYLTVDKFQDWVKLNDERRTAQERRDEDRQKLVISVTKWAATGGGFGLALGGMLKAFGVIK